jgi:hypothetical protein
LGRARLGAPVARWPRPLRLSLPAGNHARISPMLKLHGDRPLTTHRSGSLELHHQSRGPPLSMPRTNRRRHRVRLSQPPEDTAPPLHRQTIRLCFVTFDMDAVHSSSAPGVSAPSRNGLSPKLCLHAAFLASQFPLTQSAAAYVSESRIRSRWRTIGLADQTLLAFFRGFAARSPETTSNPR